MKVLITGACSGIGFLTGITLAYRGYEVIMTVHTNEQLITLKNKLKNINSYIRAYKLDLNNDEDINKIKLFDVDVLINNAGIGVGGSIIDLNTEDIKKNFEINFFKTFQIIKIFCKELIKKNKKGKVIIISSIAGVVPFEFLGSYCSSKAALIMMSRCLNKELKIIGSDIKISVIEPGAYKTGFNQVLIDKVNESITNNSPFYTKKHQILGILKLKFNIIEERSLDTIVYNIIRCVESEGKKFIYSAPFIQFFIKKIYSCLFY